MNEFAAPRMRRVSRNRSIWLLRPFLRAAPRMRRVSRNEFIPDGDIIGGCRASHEARE